jgi:hypothetical protein
MITDFESACLTGWRTGVYHHNPIRPAIVQLKKKICKDPEKSMYKNFVVGELYTAIVDYDYQEEIPPSARTLVYKVFSDSDNLAELWIEYDIFHEYFDIIMMLPPRYLSEFQK